MAPEPDTRCRLPIQQTICPTGKSANWLSSPGCKNILYPLRLTATPNQWLSRTVPSRQEGRIARRHERGTGCGGRESVRRVTAIAGRVQLVSDLQRVRRTTLMRTAKPCGPDTRC